ncbi:MAG: glycosyltransferase family 4 protein [bacterium]
MNLAMFHDWIIWKEGEEYFLDDAFSKFVTAFDQDFDYITFCGRVAARKKAGPHLYPLDPFKHRVCPFPYYGNIYSLYRRGLLILPKIMQTVKQNLDHWDLVWLEAPHPVGVLAAYLCRRKNKPFFFLVRQNLQEQVRHRNRGIKRSVSILSVHLLERLSQYLARQALIFTVGQEMLNRYQKRRLPAFPVIISLVSEKDLMLNLPQEPRTPESIKLLSIGRLDPEKGLDYLIRAVEILIEDKKHKVSLTIVGKGREEPRLKREVQKRGLSQVVKFLGYVKNGPELLNLYREHDLFIIPSLTGEGLPQTILEAMACKIPVIATTVEGIPYFIHHKMNGWLIPPANSEAICQAVLTLAGDKILRDHIVNGGARTVASCTLEREKEKMMAHIRRVLLK